MMPLEKVMQQRDMFRCRVELMRMFTELSDEALAYVWRPIAYAYFHTDEHNPEVLTSDDMKRMGLIRMTAHGSQCLAESHQSCSILFFHNRFAVI